MNSQPLTIYEMQIQVSEAKEAEGDDTALLVCLEFRNFLPIPGLGGAVPVVAIDTVYAGFLKWRYLQSSSIYRWIFH